MIYRHKPRWHSRNVALNVYRHNQKIWRNKAAYMQTLAEWGRDSMDVDYAICWLYINGISTAPGYGYVTPENFYQAFTRLSDEDRARIRCLEYHLEQKFGGCIDIDAIAKVAHERGW